MKVTHKRKSWTSLRRIVATSFSAHFFKNVAKLFSALGISQITAEKELLLG